jgi:hypothetical protein
LQNKIGKKDDSRALIAKHKNIEVFSLF